MAAAATLDSGQTGRFVAGDKYIRIGALTLGSSYTTGGVAVTRAMFELPVSLDHLEVDGGSGFSFEFDKANLKVKSFTAIRTFTATFDPASLAGTTARDDAITVTGVAATDICVGFQAPPAILASVDIQEFRVSGTNAITVRLNNPSAGAVDVASGTWTFYVTQANGAQYEVANATDLSAVSTRFRASGK